MDHDTAEGIPRLAQGSAAFDLLANPFAVLGATACMPVTELQALADGLATPDAAGAARALSVPRSRLTAEVAFLPGVVDATSTAILDALRRGAGADIAGLPPLPAANLRAHLCAAGRATAADIDGLALHEPGQASDLAAILTAERVRAGMPAIQAPILTAELDALADRHAASLVDAIARLPDAPSRLAGLVRTAPPGRLGFLRKAATVWARRSATRLAELEAAASSSFVAWRRQPLDATGLAETVQLWATWSLPQRMADARAALDHPGTLRTIRLWRDAVRHVAESGQPGLAFPVADLLARLFADLPGEASALAAERRRVAGLGEEQALAPHLLRLRELTGRMVGEPAMLQASLLKRGFGPAARGEAALLWAAFDAACGACTVSEAPWITLRDVVVALGGEHRVQGAAAALALQRGMLARAEQAGFDDLAARLGAGLRGLQRAAALHDYDRRTGKRYLPWWLAPLRRRGVLAAIGRALPLVDDPGQHAKLAAHQAALRRRIRNGRITLAVLVAIAAIGTGVEHLDDSYATNAPYRRGAIQSLATLPQAADAPAPAPAPAPVPPATPQPRPQPAFPVRDAEREPQPGTKTLSAAELRWCMANGKRLDAAEAIAVGDDATQISPLAVQWGLRCKQPNVRRRDLDSVRPEIERDRDRLQWEGEAMLGTRNP